MQEKAFAAEDARAKRLLEADAEFDARSGAEETVAMDKVFVARGYVDGDDVAGDSGGKSDLAGGAYGAILGHEERTAAGDTLDGAEETATACVLGVSRHLD